MGRRLTFEWDEHNLKHIARHGVSREEFEDTFRHPMVEEVVSSRREDRVTAMARTSLGRYLFLVYTMRTGHIRAVTAYTLPRSKRRNYDEAIEEHEQD
jgi:uncharacterized protein